MHSRTQGQKRRLSNSHVKSSPREALRADSASAKELCAAVARTREDLGRLDIFVSNAGILSMGTIDTYSLQEFERIVAVNVRAGFVSIQAAAQEMNNELSLSTVTLLSVPLSLMGAFTA
jgi:NAD(P)-dependent dehydrogenase (short-subunit alcohol dehydrogenase family)